MAPSGGVAVIRRVWSANDTYTTEYARFDEQGIAEVTAVGCLTLPQFPYGIGSDGSVFAAGTGGLAVYPGLFR
jgi:hypothetical protein